MELKIKIKDINYNEVTLFFLFLYLSITFFSVAISNICLAVAGGTFLIGITLKQINLRAFNIKIYLAITAPFLLTILSTLNSNSFNAGLGYLYLRLPILVVPLIILCINIDKKYLKKAFAIMVLAAVLASSVTFYNAVKYFNEGILFQTGFTYFITIIHHPYFGIYLLLAILGMVEFNIITNIYIKFLVIFILSLAISLTTSRIVYVLYLLAVCFYCYSILPARRFRYSMIILGFIASLFLLSNKNIFNKFINSFDYNKSPRLKLWTNSLEAVKKSENYFFGIGIGDFYESKQDVYYGHNYENEKLGKYGYNPHSQIVEFYVTNGLFGLGIIFIALWFYLLKLREQTIFAISVFTIVFLFSLFECIFNRQYGVQLYSVLIPLVISKRFRQIK